MLDRSQQFEKLMMDHLSGNISDSEECLLLDILNSDPKYKTLYTEMAKTRAISQIPLIESGKATNYKFLLKLINNGLFSFSQLNFRQYFLKVAAIIIFVLSISISTYYIYSEFNSRNNELSYETIVPHGSQSKIILPDGTVAWLNSGSTLKYNNSYGNENRTVHLTGEGYFEVQKNPKKPFLVYANKIKVKVLGTVFNVRAYSDETSIEVNLLEGKVDILLDQAHSPQIISLLPNEKMVFNKHDNTITSCKTDAARSATWTTGKLCFVDASLEDISKDLERRFDIQIVIKSQRIKDELFSGSLDLNQPVEKILEYIDVDKKYTKRYNGRTIYITNKN